LAEGLGFVDFASGVEFDPFANQDIRLFCFIVSAWGLELGAIVVTASEEQTLQLNFGKEARWSLFVRAFGSQIGLLPKMKETWTTEDILSDSLAFLGGDPVVDNDSVHYGPLILTIAPKVPCCAIFAPFVSVLICFPTEGRKSASAVCLHNIHLKYDIQRLIRY
jgi:hypothetical protein